MNLNARDQMCVDRFRAAWTLQEIADSLGVTRQAVSSRLRRLGMSRADGGASARARQLAAERRLVLEEKQRARYGGITRREFLAVDRKVRYAYHFQKCAAHQAGVVWTLTFVQWLKIWQQSGHLHERGLGLGKYMLTRIDKRGWFAPGNVHVVEHGRNSQDTQHQVYARRLARHHIPLDTAV